MPILILVVVAFFVQYTNPSIIGADGYLHGRMAMMVGEHGFLKSLPQASQSLLATRFSDKDFLYHLYLIPFTSIGGYIAGTKAGAFVATSALLVSLALVLFLSTKSWQLSWLSLLLLLSSQFLRDTAEARPLVFALTFTVWGLYALSQRNIKLLFVVSLLYGVMHLSAWILPAVTILTFIADWMATGTAKGKLVVASLLGYALSFLLHPNFPTNIYSMYLNGILVPWYAAKTGVLELGVEFFPLFTRDLIRVFPMGIAAAIIVPLLWFVSPFRPKSRSGPWLIALFTIGGLSFISRRNLTHVYPVFIVFLGIFLDDWWKEIRNEHRALRERIGSVLVPVTILLVAGSVWITILNTRQTFTSDRIYSDHYLRVTQKIGATIPKGERIFHANWSDPQYFIGLAPEYQYLVTLDPIYMYAYDPNLYTLYRQISHGEYPNPVDGIVNSFGAHYVYAGKVFFSPFANQLKGIVGVRILYEDDLGVLLALPN